jgi:hypothetical protein
MEEQQPAHEPHPDEETDTGLPPAEGDEEDEPRIDEPLPGEERLPETTTPPHGDQLVDRVQSLIHGGLVPRAR